MPGAPATLVPARKSLDALPAHCALSTMISRTRPTVDLDRVAPVVGISGFKGARGPKCALTGCGPDREVSHARLPLEAHMPLHV